MIREEEENKIDAARTTRMKRDRRELLNCGRIWRR